MIENDQDHSESPQGINILYAACAIVEGMGCRVITIEFVHSHVLMGLLSI